jgi:uroporphyrinogen-III synthase
MRPLAGRKILITRARHQAQSLASALEEKGATVIAIPAIEIIPPDSYDALDAALWNAKNYQWLVVTSANGAEVLAERLTVLKSPIAALDALKIAAIGPATARALGEMGLHVDEVPKQAIAESLVESLRDQVGGKKVLLVRAKVARDVLPDELRHAGAIVDVVDAYQTIVPATSADDLRLIFAASSRMPDVVTFTSSSTVTNFFRLLHEANVSAWPAAMAAASIGPITSQTLRHHGIEPAVEATEYTIPGVVDALCRWSAAHGAPANR